MSQAERHLRRDRSYGVWHRVKSIARFLSAQEAEQLCMLDLDSVLFAEYDGYSQWPLCLVEVARDIGQSKPAGVIQRLAQLADIPAYVALYTPADAPNPANENWTDISSFRVKRLWPRPELFWRRIAPGDWARRLVQIREWQLRRFQEREAANDPQF